VAVGGLLASLATAATAAQPVEITMHDLGDEVVPHSIAFSPAGSDAAGTMWFTDNAGGSLYMADPDDVDGRTEIPLGSGSGPRGVAAGPDAVWVAGYGDDTLYRVPLTDGEPGPPEALDLAAELGLPAGTAHPSYIALTADGESAWVTLTSVDKVVELRTDGALEDAVVEAHPAGDYTLPTRIVEGPDGRLWFSGQSGTYHGVGAMTRAGVLTSYPLPIAGVAFGLAAGAEHVYVADYTNGVVHQIAMNGSWRAEPWILQSGSLPAALVVAQDDTGTDTMLWAAESGTGSLAQINLETGHLEESIEVGAGSRPYGLASDPASNTVWGTANAVHSLFSLDVTPGAAAGIVIVSGDGQQAAPGTSFAENVRVVVRDSAGAPLQGVPVTFTIQGGTGSTFVGGSHTTTAVTDGDGLAGSTRIDAGFSGSLPVVAQIPDGSSVQFTLLVSGSTYTGVNPFTGEVR